ncbi:MAG: hypothetical protein BM556_17945 [Bacteriovorax sp. MedPE-SWde]|nr:MAG: hypothetical protein BM556_17945 [Bacteriovorax sp. MedPE-SWde]
MNLAKCLLFSALVITNIYTHAGQLLNLDKYQVDKNETDSKYNTVLKSGKHDGVRFYQAVREQEYNATAEKILEIVLNFKSRCNNELSSKRIYDSKDFKCSHHNKGLIESKIIKQILPHKKDKNEIETYLVQRRVYNRELFEYYEVLRIFKVGKKTSVYTKMLTDKQASVFINGPKTRSTVLKEIQSVYTIEEVSKTKTKLSYTYLTTTDHWLLNKSVAVSQFFDGMVKSINLFFNSVKTDITRA